MSLEASDPQTMKVLSRAYFLLPLLTRYGLTFFNIIPLLLLNLLLLRMLTDTFSINHFQRLLHEDREVHQDDPRGLEVTIRRKSIFEDSLKHLQNINLRKVSVLSASLTRP